MFWSERLLWRHDDVVQIDWNNLRRGLIRNIVAERNISHVRSVERKNFLTKTFLLVSSSTCGKQWLRLVHDKKSEQKTTTKNCVRCHNRFPLLAMKQTVIIFSKFLFFFSQNTDKKVCEFYKMCYNDSGERGPSRGFETLKKFIAGCFHISRAPFASINLLTLSLLSK